MKSSYLFNLCIAKRDIIHAYAPWSFDILFAFDKEFNISDRTLYQQRINGFLTERFFPPG